MEKEKITFEQFCNPEFRRSEQMKVKSEAIWVTFLELDGLINISKLAKHYFNRSHSWFAQKLHGNSVAKKERAFTEAECAKLTSALRDVAKRLNEYADAINKAKFEQ